MTRKQSQNRKAAQRRIKAIRQQRDAARLPPRAMADEFVDLRKIWEGYPRYFVAYNGILFPSCQSASIWWDDCQTYLIGDEPIMPIDPANLPVDADWNDLV